MNLAKKKQLAAETLKVGKHRIVFNIEGLPEIKEAITKQDIKTLFQEGIITIKPVKGRRKVKKRKTRRENSDFCKVEGFNISSNFLRFLKSLEFISNIS